MVTVQLGSWREVSAAAAPVDIGFVSTPFSCLFTLGSDSYTCCVGRVCRVGYVEVVDESGSVRVAPLVVVVSESGLPYSPVAASGSTWLAATTPFPPRFLSSRVTPCYSVDKFTDRCNFCG